MKNKNKLTLKNLKQELEYLKTASVDRAPLFFRFEIRYLNQFFNIYNI
jgi:hypothetical protein